MTNISAFGVGPVLLIAEMLIAAGAYRLLRYSPSTAGGVPDQV